MKLFWTGVAYIHGVPARDLSAVEAREYADVITQQQLLTGLTIYRKADADGDAPLTLDTGPDDDNPAEE